MIKADHISKSFDGRVVLDDVSVEFDTGTTNLVIGKSGSGKTVTAMSLTRLLPPPPACTVRGEINFGGKNVAALPPDELRKIRGRQIAYIFQEPSTSLNPVFTVGFQIAEAVRLHFPEEKNVRKRVVESLAEVGIREPDKRCDAYPHELSGGMQQRVMIAMALACRPRLLVADEPTTALDVTIQAQIMRLLKQLQEKMGTSIILITHDLGIVAQIAKHVMVMYCGQAVEYSDVRSIYKNPLHPYTAGLLRSIPKLTDDDMEELPSIPGMVPSPSEKLQGCRFAPRCEKCGARCKKEMPDLVTLEDGRKVRCFLYEGGVEG